MISFLTDLSRNLIFYLFYATLTLTVFRLVIKIILSLTYNLAKKKENGETYPRFSIIVPAYNEEKTIGACLQSLINLDYPDYEVIVIDDGSTDATLREAKRFASLGVKVLHQENKGKAEALNRGIRASTGDLILTVDADTRLDREALKRLRRRFMNPKIGAVAGNIKVSVTYGILNIIQAAEYTTTINLTRKAESMFGCVMIVPGPIAAFRRDAIVRAGLFSSDTFAEDFDVTMKVLKRGYRVGC